MRKLRITLAAIMLTGITLMLCGLASQTGNEWGDAAWIQTHLSWMAKIQFLPALLSITGGHFVLGGLTVIILLFITALFGRIYCSVICPLGIMQDVFAWIGRSKVWKKLGLKKLGPNHYRYSHDKKAVRLTILGVFTIACCMPISAAWAHLIAPYSAYARMVQGFWGNNSELLIIAIITLVVIGIWSLVSGRAWCNTICPVGTILGLVGKHAVYRPVIDNTKCNGCHKCERNCKAQCIDAATHSVDMSRCVDCLDCIDNCAQKAIAFTKNPQKESAKTAVKDEKDGQVNTSRRAFLATAGIVGIAGMTASAQHKVDGGLAAIEKKRVPTRTTPLHPAGSKSLRHFASHCTGCQLCVSACPQQVLRPSTDLDRLMQPEMQFDLGYCPVSCHRCSDVCPAGAISLKDECEKSSIQIGHAVWIAENCAVLSDDVKCGNCARHCPTGAIVMVPYEGNEQHMVPAVDSEKCIGCGHCEYVCPSRPLSAIYVEGHESERII